MKTILSVAVLFITLHISAQSWQGVYNTKYGTLRLVQETGFEYDGGALVYGDYGDKGTITGKLTNQGKDFEGYFHNGSASGKFILKFEYPIGAPSYFVPKDFTGYYGYGEQNNNYSDKADWQWTGSRTQTNQPANIKTAVWSGKWKTNFGDIILQQIGNKVSGKYKTSDRIDATYDPVTRILKGTFTNGSNKGLLELKMEGNSFSGKWGWGNNLNEGNWTGTKSVKSNQVAAASASASTTTVAARQKKYRIQASDVVIKEASGNIFSIDAPIELYGFAGFKLEKQTVSKTENIPAFGNQPANYFDRTEDKYVSVSYNKNTLQHKYVFPSGSGFRDFLIPESELNQQNVDYYFVAFAHFKEEDTGGNDNFGYKAVKFSLKTLQLNKTYTVSNSTSDGSYTLSFKITEVQ